MPSPDPEPISDMASVSLSSVDPVWVVAGLSILIGICVIFLLLRHFDGDDDFASQVNYHVEGILLAANLLQSISISL